MKYTADFGDGHTLSCAEYGDPAGLPILVHHGLIASIDDGELFQRLVDAGRRVVCLARPGYGLSTPYALDSIGAWGDLVARLADDLDLDAFDVLGMSSGAPYCYAVAQRLPERVRRVYVFSGTPALYHDEVLSHWPYPVSDSATVAEMQHLARELFFSNLSDEDRARNDMRDSMASNCFGPAQDMRLRYMDWGFSLKDVRQPVIMEHSRKDGEVPFVTATLTAQMLPHCKFRARDGDHFSPSLLDQFLAAMLDD